jgi:hypothetical protein
LRDISFNLISYIISTYFGTDGVGEQEVVVGLDVAQVMAAALCPNLDACIGEEDGTASHLGSTPLK